MPPTGEQVGLIGGVGVVGIAGLFAGIMGVLRYRKERFRRDQYGLDVKEAERRRFHQQRKGRAHEWMKLAFPTEQDEEAHVNVGEDGHSPDTGFGQANASNKYNVVETAVNGIHGSNAPCNGACNTDNYNEDNNNNHYHHHENHRNISNSSSNSISSNSNEYYDDDDDDDENTSTATLTATATTGQLNHYYFSNAELTTDDRDPYDGRLKKFILEKPYFCPSQNICSDEKTRRPEEDLDDQATMNP